MVFILFDVEIAFVYPWALVFRSAGWPLFVEMLAFLGHPRRRLRLHLEEGGVRLVSHTRYRIEEAGEPRKFPARGHGPDREDPDALPDQAGGAAAGALGGAGDLGLDLEGVGRGGRADPRAAALARGRRADLLHDVQPPARSARTCSRSARRSPATCSGPRRLVEHCGRKLGIGLEETTKDGKFTLVEVECIAGCDKAPSMMVNDTYYEPMDATKLDAAPRAARAGVLTWRRS